MPRDSRKGWLVTKVMRVSLDITPVTVKLVATAVLCPPQVKVTKQHNEECQRLLSLMGIPFVAVSNTATTCTVMQIVLYDVVCWLWAPRVV